MAKPIRLTETFIEKMTKEFVEKLRTTNFADGKVSYTRSFTWKNESRIDVLFTPEAYAKMLMLVHHYDCEVAWHGIVDRPDGSTFIIRDILVYPQEVTGVTVDTDQEEYQKWLMNLDDEVFNGLRLQGHSHVDMGVTPSTVDLAHQESILEQLDGNNYYIFMIVNKKLDYTIKVYDLKSNTLYETSDVHVSIASENGDVEAFLKEAETLVHEKPLTIPPKTGVHIQKAGGKQKQSAAFPDYIPPYQYYHNGYGYFNE